jgi:hypothetical protein
VSACLAALIVTGCATASGSSTDPPVPLFKQLVSWSAGGQYERMYEVTYPAQQKAIRYSKYFECVVQDRASAKAFGVDLKTMRFVRARVGSSEKFVNVPGTKLRVPATPVWSTVSVVEGGKRTTLPHDSPDFFTRVGRKWRYIDPDIGDYLKPNCGN